MLVSSWGNKTIFPFFQIIRNKEANESINVKIEEVNFDNCGTEELTLLGGAIYIDGFKHRSGPGSLISILNSNFTNCQASFGAAIYRDKILSARQTRLFTVLGPLNGIRDLLQILLTNVKVIGSQAFSQGVVQLTDSSVSLKKR